MKQMERKKGLIFGASLCVGAALPMLWGIASCGSTSPPAAAPIVLRVDARNATDGRAVEGDIEFRLCVKPDSCRPAANDEERKGVFRLGKTQDRIVVQVLKPGYAPATAVADFRNVDLNDSELLEAGATAMLLKIPDNYIKTHKCDTEESFNFDGLELTVPAVACGGEIYAIEVAMSKPDNLLRALPGPLEWLTNAQGLVQPLAMLSMVHISIKDGAGNEIKNIKPRVSFPTLLAEPALWPEDVIIEGPAINTSGVAAWFYNDTSGYWEETPESCLLEKPLVSRNGAGEIIEQSANWRVELPHLSWWGIFKKKETHCVHIRVQDMSGAGVPHYPVGAQGVSFTDMMLAKFTKGGNDPGHACLELPMGEKSQIFLGYPYDPALPMPSPLLDIDMPILDPSAQNHCQGHGENQPPPQCLDGGVLVLPIELCEKNSQGTTRDCPLQASSNPGISCKQTCGTGGFWGPCESSSGISNEVCDGEDNDCDGFVDNIPQKDWDCNTVSCGQDGGLVYEAAPTDFEIGNPCVTGCAPDPNNPGQWTPTFAADGVPSPSACATVSATYAACCTMPNYLCCNGKCTLTQQPTCN